MKLETITLTNFGSYQGGAVDLSSVAAAVICGSNGAGKSTGFVDAPLWALFGKCRTETDKMVRLGADVMSVSLTFLLNGQRYKVTRTRSLKTKSGKTELALLVESAGTWTQASGARLGDTQQRILELLNADYELLTATGFLLQGNADRFSRATPAERKTILAQILRLDQYAPLKTAAHRHVSAGEATKEGKRGRLQVAEQTAAGLERFQGIKTKADETLTTTRQRLTTVEADRTELLQVQAGTQAALQGLADVVERMTRARGRLTELQDKERALIERRDRLAKILQNRDRIDAKVIEEATTRAQLQAMNDEAQAAVVEIEQLGTKLADAQQEIAKGDRLASDLEQARRTVAVAVKAYHEETRRLREALDRDATTCSLLTKVPCNADLQGRCQFTTQAAGLEKTLPDRRQLFAHRLADDVQIAEESVPDEVATVARLEQERDAWRVQGWPDKLRNLQLEQGKQRAARKTFTDRRRQLEQTLEDVAKFTKLVPELKAAEIEIPRVESDLAGLVLDAGQVRDELADLQTQLERKEGLETQLGDSGDRLTAIETERRGLQHTERELTGQLGQLVERIQSATQAEQDAAALRSEVETLAAEVRAYQALADAYALIPVLVLEQAIPLLEQEANGILGKISRSGMAVRLDTQKALKNREGLAETLDIVVRDVYGERPYESYSGGEKFRLDLALRIGLSKLLSTRAGARLETLVIDEGLGSLDEDGLAQLRECLSALGKDFPLVLVVTHVEAMKHTFPAQIVVAKNGAGSTIEVLA